MLLLYFCPPTFSLSTSASDRRGLCSKVRVLWQPAEAVPFLRRHWPSITGLRISKLLGKIGRGLLWKGPLPWHHFSAFQKFCCERNRDLFEFIVNERKNHEGAWSVPVAVGPHESHSTEADRLLSKERAYQRYRDMTAGRTGDQVCIRNNR